ncbi:glucokinase [soil metagenome]
MGGTHLDALPFPALIGDVGGTNARFSLIADPQAPAERFPTAHTADYATIDDAIEATVLAKTKLRPKSALLALAGPITGEQVPLTNCPWVVEPRKSVKRFGLSEMILLNDFEAQSLSLPGLGAADLDPVGGGEIAEDRARVVIGPGTGLGAGAMIRARDIWIPVPGEGGHIGLGPITKRELAIWPHVEREGPRVSGETILCGAGMLRLYRAIAANDGVAAELDTPAAVTAAGLAGKDRQATETLEIFAAQLGRIAGDIALIYMAYGGVYLAGGITTRIAPVLKAGGFRAAFIDKWPHEKLMERMATAIIVKEDAALAGIADFARAPGRFGVELGGRRWRG